MSGYSLKNLLSSCLPSVIPAVDDVLRTTTTDHHPPPPLLFYCVHCWLCSYVIGTACMCVQTYAYTCTCTLLTTNLIYIYTLHCTLHTHEVMAGMLYTSWLCGSNKGEGWQSQCKQQGCACAFLLISWVILCGCLCNRSLA